MTFLFRHQSIHKEVTNHETIFFDRIRYALTLLPSIAIVSSAHAITLQGMVESGSTASVRPPPYVTVTLFEATRRSPRGWGARPVTL